MPPRRKSSSSASSRSRGSKATRRSRSSHSSSSYRSSNTGLNKKYDRKSEQAGPKYIRRNQPICIPPEVEEKAVLVRCKNHDYLYVHKSWTVGQTGKEYRKGYYDEDGKFYDSNNVAFKKPDGSYEARYVCEHCGAETETDWKEGFYPTCKNCGAEMEKTPVYIDEILEVKSLKTDEKKTDDSKLKLDFIDISTMIVAAIVGVYIIAQAFFTGTTPTPEKTDTNLEIYGSEIYLDEISPQTYRICSGQDDYEKHLTWDKKTESYYDRESDCYLWYNTDVSPNLWQYWYDDIAGNHYYGWMECDGVDWYIEVSDTEWEKYEGDTSQLWYIEE